jgi:hypothetical protein
MVEPTRFVKPPCITISWLLSLHIFTTADTSSEDLGNNKHKDSREISVFQIW